MRIKINQQRGVPEIGSNILDPCSMRQNKEQPLYKHKPTMFVSLYDYCKYHNMRTATYKVCPESYETDSRKIVSVKICLHTLNILQNNILEHQYTVVSGSATRRSSPGSLELGSLAEHSSRQPAARF